MWDSLLSNGQWSLERHENQRVLFLSSFKKIVLLEDFDIEMRSNISNNEIAKCVVANIFRLELQFQAEFEHIKQNIIKYTRLNFMNIYKFFINLVHWIWITQDIWDSNKYTNLWMKIIKRSLRTTIFYFWNERSQVRI